jgi:hypothetical protein
MPVLSQSHYGFHSFPVVDWFCLFINLWVLTFPLEDCSEFGNVVITLMSYIKIPEAVNRWKTDNKMTKRDKKRQWSTKHYTEH